MRWLWPIHTGKTFFDVWSIVHFAFWIFIGSVAWSVQSSRAAKPGVLTTNALKAVLFLGCMGIAYGWEIFERYAEKKWPNLWLNPESWHNSWISDPLMCVLGVLGIWYALSNWRKP